MAASESGECHQRRPIAESCSLLRAPKLRPSLLHLGSASISVCGTLLNQSGPWLTTCLLSAWAQTQNRLALRRVLLLFSRLPCSPSTRVPQLFCAQPRVTIPEKRRSCTAYKWRCHTLASPVPGTYLKKLAAHESLPVSVLHHMAYPRFLVPAKRCA